MKKNQIRVVIALIVGTSFVIPTIVSAQNRLMIRLLDKVAQQSLKGYTRPNNVKSRIGYLDEGNQIEIPIKLTKGNKYGFVAVCDENCNDIDLSLKDANNRLIREDNGEEKTAVVEYTAKKTGRYYLSVDMVSCDDAECAYGVGLYRKKVNQQNQTNPTPTPSPSPTPNPTPTPSPSPTPNPTPTPSPSPPTPTSSKNELTQQALQQTLDFNKQVNNTFENLLQSGKPVEQAINEVKAMLEANPAEVKSGSIEISNDGLSWKTQNDVIVLLNLSKFTGNGQRRGGGGEISHLPAKSLFLAQNAIPHLPTRPLFLAQNVTDNLSKTVSVGKKEALILAPYAWQFEPNGGDETNEIADLLKKVGYKLTDKNYKRNEQQSDSKITFDDFKNLEQYGVIVISTHGTTRGEEVYISTGQKVPEEENLRDIARAILSTQQGALETDRTIAIGPSFITTYTKGKLPNSLVYISGCKSTANLSLSNAFKEKGAAAYVGYSNTVTSKFANEHGRKMFEVLADGNPTSKIPEMYDFDTDSKEKIKAQFQIYGLYKDNLVIVPKCPSPQKTTFQDSSGNLRNGPKTVKEEDLTQKSGTFKLTGKVLSNERDIYKFQTETPSDIKVEFSFGNPDSGANNESLEVWFASNEKQFISSSGLRDGKPIPSGATQTFENVPPGCFAIALTPMYTVKSGTRTYDVTVTITPRPVKP